MIVKVLFVDIVRLKVDRFKKVMLAWIFTVRSTKDCRPK